MARNDGLLYSGMASNSRLSERRRLLKEQAERKRNELKPNHDVITALIESERSQIADRVLALVNNNSDEKNLKATLLALKLHDEFLIRLHASVVAIIKPRSSDG